MFVTLPTSRAWLAAGLLLAAFALSAAAPAFGRPAAQDEERGRAFEMFAEQEMAEALPLLEELAARRPDDGPVLARLGFVLYLHSILRAGAGDNKRSAKFFIDLLMFRAYSRRLSVRRDGPQSMLVSPRTP